ncbi:MAG: ABC transporter ATP-binding protein, partial [Streptococcus sp.]|nr:ABC transporter ATP-binding protein [Streptococcus sp.]
IADRVIQMHDAKIKSVETNPNPQKIEDLEY